MTLFSNVNEASTEEELEEMFKEIQSSFSEEQKVGIMSSLMRVSDADGEFHLLEVQLLRMIAGMLNFELKDSREEIKEELFKIDGDDVLLSLGSLNEEQKDWYIFTLAAVMGADNKILEEEKAYAKIFLEHMHIGKERFDSVVGNSKNLLGHFA